VQQIFPRTVPVGVQFGVVLVLEEGEEFQVATFRRDGVYLDSRHPVSVTFGSAEEDAARRDFTINGMFYDPLQERVIDYVGGQADLERHILRTIGDPQERFSEDYLRMLRAVRFSTQLRFAIEPETYAAIQRNATSIVHVSGERIAVELEGILVHPNRATGAALLLETGLAQAIFPGFTGPGTQQAAAVLRHLRKNVGFPLALAALFAGFPTAFGVDRCETLKLSRKQNQHLEFLLAHRGHLLDAEMSLAALKKLLAQPYFRDLYELERALQKAVGAKEGLAALGRLCRRVRDLGDIDVKPKPLLNGHDLMRLGAVPGPALGQLAEELYVAQLEGDVQTKEQAQQWASAWLQQHRPQEP
jgi:poly(A) polymerase